MLISPEIQKAAAALKAQRAAQRQATDTCAPGPKVTTADNFPYAEDPQNPWIGTFGLSQADLGLQDEVLVDALFRVRNGRYVINEGWQAGLVTWHTTEAGQTVGYRLHRPQPTVQLQALPPEVELAELRAENVNLKKWLDDAKVHVQRLAMYEQFYHQVRGLVQPSESAVNGQEEVRHVRV